jgi:hypothetical protein
MLSMPVLALGREYSFGSAVLDSMKSLAIDVHGGIVPLSGQWIAEVTRLSYTTATIDS